MDIPKMIECEINFPRHFTNTFEREGVIFFHNEDIPDSHDSNHVVITDLTRDIDRLLRDVEEFYTERGVEPRLYPAYIPGEFEILEPHLQSHGFHYEQFDNWWATYAGSAHSTISPVEDLLIRREREVSDELATMIFDTERRERPIKVLRLQVLNEKFHLHVGYVRGEPVTHAAFTILDGHSMIDGVLTGANHRGNGYCSTLIDHLCKAHERCSDNVLYLWATNPVAIKIYQNAGFKAIDSPVACWGAWKPLDAG